MIVSIFVGGDHVNEDREMLSAKLKELKQRFHANVSSAVNMQQLINKGKVDVHT